MRKTVIVVVLAVALGTSKPSTAGLNRWTSHSPLGADVVGLAGDSSGQTVYAATAGNGMYKSTDAGEHWQAVNHGLDLMLSSVTVDPADPSIVYTSAASGLFTTTDGGASWIRRDGFGPVQLKLAIGADPRTLYAAASYAALRSTNSGETWDKVAHINATSIAVLDGRTFLGTDQSLYFSDDWVTWQIAPQITGPVLAVTAEGGTQNVFVATRGAMFSSHDRGATWNPLPLDGLPSAVQTLTAADGRLYATTSDGVFRFEGSQWAAFTGSLSGLAVKAVMAVQSNSELLAATNVGAFKTDIAHPLWRDSSRGFDRATANDVSLAPHDPHVAVAATQLGILRSVDRGETWDQTFSEPAKHVRVSAAAPTTVYATTAKAILKSKDQGQHWEGIHASAVTSGIDVSADGQTVYAALSSGMAKTADGGINWALSSGGLNTYYSFYDEYTMDVVTVDPTNSSNVYGAEWDGLYVTYSSGQTWALTNGEYVRAIAVDPNSPARVYAARSDIAGGLLVSADRGAHWSVEPVAEPIVSLAVSAADSSVYAGTRSGHVYTRMATSTSWTRIDDGLPPASVNGISIGASGNTFYAATSAGIYEYDRMSATFIQVPADATYVSHLLNQTSSADESQFVIPIAGAGAGAHGTSFMTDLIISNGLEKEQDIVLAWLPAGSATPLSASRISVPAASNGPFVADSIANDLGAAGIGTLIVTAVTSSGEIDLNAQLDGSARIWTTSAEAGETSQPIASVHPGAFRSRTTATVSSLRQDSAFRTNIGIVNLDSRPQQYVVDARGERHQERFMVTVPPLSLLHIPLPGGDYGELQVTVTSTDASRWTLYGTTIENDTGAATTTIGTS